jgi:hypothetical protein
LADAHISELRRHLSTKAGKGKAETQKPGMITLKAREFLAKSIVGGDDSNGVLRHYRDLPKINSL